MSDVGLYGRQAVDLLSTLYVAAAMLVVLVARSKFVRRTGYRLLPNFFALSACIAIYLSAVVLAERAVEPLRRFELKEGDFVDSWPAINIALGLIPFVLAYGAWLLLSYLGSRRGTT
jgi:hypothetical protein